MKFASAQLNKQMPRFLALALCLWLSGAMSAAACGAMTRQTIQISGAAQKQPSSCPMHRETSVQTANDGAANRETIVSTQDDALRYCPFIGFQNGKARKLNDGGAFVLTAATAKIEFSLETLREIQFHTAYRSFQRVKSDVYLRNCTFLI